MSAPRALPAAGGDELVGVHRHWGPRHQGDASAGGYPSWVWGWGWWLLLVPWERHLPGMLALKEVQWGGRSKGFPCRRAGAESWGLQVHVGVSRSMSCLHPQQGWSCGQRPSLHTDVSSPADPAYQDAGAPRNMSLSCRPIFSFAILGAPGWLWQGEGGQSWWWLAAALAWCCGKKSISHL